MTNLGRFVLAVALPAVLSVAGVSLLGAGCGTPTSTDDLGGVDDFDLSVIPGADLSGGGDGSVASDLSGMFNFDAGTIVGIACGNTPCAANAQYCCTSNQGKTGMCGFGAGAECGSALFYCDGPEDCPPAESFCCVANGTGQCRSNACPGTIMGGYAMCHTTPDCKGAGTCCASKTGSPYSLCLPDPCP